MGINVTVDGLEAMPPAAIRNVATLLTLMADHIEQSVTGMPIRGEDAMQSRVIAPRVPIVTPDQPTSPSAAFAPPDNPTTQAPGIDVDAAGLPWDGRIHASSRALIADGTWRQRRNLDPAILATVTAELKQLMSLPAATSPAPAAVAPVPPAPSAALVPTPPPFVDRAGPPAPPGPTIPVPASVGAAQTVSPSSAPGAATFPELMKRITAAYTAKTLDQAMIQSAVSSVGLPSLPMLVSRPDLVQAVATALGLTI